MRVSSHDICALRAQSDADAVQTCPLGLTARAVTRSVPDMFGSSRRTSNEPLGATVVACVETRCTPFCDSVTRHVTPLRFWSTSNSVSMRPSSGLSLSFDVAEPVQDPETRTSLSFASAPGAPAAASRDVAASAVARRWMVDM